VLWIGEALPQRTAARTSAVDLWSGTLAIHVQCNWLARGSVAERVSLREVVRLHGALFSFQESTTVEVVIFKITTLGVHGAFGD
jgi:hypothetical protein